MQKTLEQTVIDPVTKVDAIPDLARAWLELEWFKREVRGKPRLKNVDPVEMLRISAASRAARATLLSPTEIDVQSVAEHQSDKESLTKPTVTAPPTP
jgi:hypothetical protein